jgi:hypothetical protein
MDILQDLADAFAVGRGMDVLTIQLRDAGHLSASQGLQMTGTTLMTADDNGDPLELSMEAQAFVVAFVPPEPTLTRDERLLAAVDAAKVAVTGGAFTPQQAATLQAVFDGLGAAISESP